MGINKTVRGKKSGFLLKEPPLTKEKRHHKKIPQYLQASLKESAFYR